MASNGRYSFVEIKKLSMWIDIEIMQNVISIYMKDSKNPLLWKFFFFNTVKNRDYINNYCKRPFNNFDKLCQEWYLFHIIDDVQIRMLNEGLNNGCEIIGSFRFLVV